MAKQTGFTLVELLVVIAIISLLIAIVAPTLNAAKDLARSSYCRATLNALNKSSLVYTEQNKGCMMVYRHQTVTVGGVSYIMAPQQPSKTTVAFVQSAPDPTTGLYSEASNFGLLYAAKILDKPEMFYCPAPIKDERHMLKSYPRPWGSGGTAGTNWVRCGYMWDPWVLVLEGASSADMKCTFEDDLRLDRHDPARFLTSDLIWATNVSGHVEGNRCHWNLGYADGHVTPFTSVPLWQTYQTGVETATEWGNYGAAPRTSFPGITRPELEKF